MRVEACVRRVAAGMAGAWLAVALAAAPATAGPELHPMAVAHNQVRLAYGLSQLSHDWQLSDAAAIRARELVVRFDHAGTYRYNRIDELLATRYGWVGENIARTNMVLDQQEIDLLMADWLASLTHKAIILDARWVAVGVGIWVEGEFTYIAVLFGEAQP